MGYDEWSKLAIKYARRVSRLQPGYDNLGALNFTNLIPIAEVINPSPPTISSLV